MGSDIGKTGNGEISGLPMLMRAQMQAEFDLAHARYEHRIDLLRKTIMGFATNGTNCLACRMSNECATEALARDDTLKGAPK